MESITIDSTSPITVTYLPGEHTPLSAMSASVESPRNRLIRKICLSLRQEEACDAG